MSREDDVGAAGVGEAAKDSRDELEDILKALEAGDSDKHGPNVKIIIGVIAGIVHPYDTCNNKLTWGNCR